MPRGGKKVNTIISRLIDELAKIFVEVAKVASKKVDEEKFKSATEEKAKEIHSAVKKTMNKVAKVQDKQKDPNAPKRPKTSYLCFCQDQRKVIVKENPDITNPQITVKLAQKWKSLSEKEKAKYIKLAEKEKLAYTEAMKNYVPPEGTAPKEKAKKGQTGYNLFCKEKRKEVAKKNKGIGPREIMSKLGEMWKNLSQKEKDAFKVKAEELNKKEGIETKKDGKKGTKKAKSTKGTKKAKSTKKEEPIVEEHVEDKSDEDDHSEHSDDERSDDEGHSEDEGDHSEPEQEDD